MAGTVQLQKKIPIREEDLYDSALLAKKLDVEENLLKKLITAYGLNPQNITIEQFKDLMVKTGISYVDSAWYRTKGRDAAAVVESLLEDFASKEKGGGGTEKATVLSSKLEGAMFVAIAAKNACMSDEEVLKLVGRKAATEGKVTYFDGLKEEALTLSLAQHIGVAYMGLGALDARFANAGVEKLVDDYSKALTGIINGAKTADEAGKRLRYSEALEAVTASLAAESAKIMRGETYAAGSLENGAKLLEKKFNELPATVTKIAAELGDAKFAKQIAKSIDEPAEQEKFRRFFASAFLIDNFYKYGGEGGNALDNAVKLGIYSYLAFAAKGHISRKKSDAEFADGMYKMRNYLGDKIYYLETTDLQAYQKIETNFIKAILSKDQAKGKEAVQNVINAYMQELGVKDKEIAMFFRPQILEQMKDESKLPELKAALKDARELLGISETDMALLMNGEHDKFLAALEKSAKFKASDFYTLLSSKGYKPDEITDMAMNFYGTTAHICLLNKDSSREVLKAVANAAPKRKDVELKWIKKGVKDVEKQYITEDAQLAMWREANKRLSETKKEYGFGLGAASGALKADAVNYKKAAAMFGLDIINKQVMTPEELEKSDVFVKWRDQIDPKHADDLGPAGFLASMIHPAMILMKQGKSEEEVKKIVSDYIDDCVKNGKPVLAEEAIAKLRSQAVGSTMKSYTIPYNFAKRSWDVKVEHIGSDIVVGSGAADALTKHMEYEVKSRFKLEKDWGKLSKKVYGDPLPEFLAKQWGGPVRAKKGYGQAVAASLSELKKNTDFKDWDTITAFSKSKDSIYDALVESCESIAKKHFASLDAAGKGEMKKEFFLSYLAVIKAEQNVRVDELNTLISQGAAQKFDEQTVKRAVLSTVHPQKGQEYTIWHVKEDGSREAIGNYLNGKATCAIESVNWKLGDMYYISHGEKAAEKVDGYITALYFRGRNKYGNFAFMRNGNKDAELTILNIRAYDNPFNISWKKPGAAPPEWDAVRPTPTSLSGYQQLKGGDNRSDLQYLHFIKPELGMTMPLISQTVTIKTTPPTTTMGPPITNITDQGGLGIWARQKEVDDLLVGFGNKSLAPGGYNNEAIRQEVVALIDNVPKLAPDIIKNVVNAGSGDIYLSRPVAGQPSVVTTTKPPEGTYYIRLQVAGKAFTIYTPPRRGETQDERRGAGTITASEITVEGTTSKITEIQAPVYLTLNNLAHGMLPWGIQYSAGTKVSLMFNYDTGTKLPKSYAGGVNFNPYLTLSRPFELGKGIIVNPYAMGMWDVRGNTVAPSFGVSLSRSFQGDIFGASISGGGGFDTGTSRVFPYLGAGASAYGTYLGAGVNPGEIGKGLLYGEAGYDMDRDGIMDYGVRMMNAGPIWIPDVIIDGQGIVSSMFSGIAGIYKKIRGVGAL